MLKRKRWGNEKNDILDGFCSELHTCDNKRKLWEYWKSDQKRSCSYYRIGLCDFLKNTKSDLKKFKKNKKETTSNKTQKKGVF